MITTVTFDAGQTLIENARMRRGHVLAAVAGVGIGVLALRGAAAQPAAWQRYEQLVAGGGHDQPWQVFMAALIAGATGVAADAAAALAAWLWTEQPRRNLWRRPVPGMIELVRELRAAGIAVGVLSNSEGHLAALFVEWFSMKPMLAYHGALNEKILEEAKSKYGATITKMEGAFREEARKRTAHLLNDYVAGGGEQAAKSAALLKQLG